MGKNGLNHSSYQTLLSVDRSSKLKVPGDISRRGGWQLLFNDFNGHGGSFDPVVICTNRSKPMSSHLQCSWIFRWKDQLIFDDSMFHTIFPSNQWPFQEPIDWRYLGPTTKKANSSGLNFEEYPHRMWPQEKVQYLQFRSLKFRSKTPAKKVVKIRNKAFAKSKNSSSDERATARKMITTKKNP